MSGRPNGSLLRRLAIRSPLMVYFVIAFAAAWVGWVPFAVYSQINPEFVIPNVVYLLAPFACGPTFAGIALSWLTGGRDEVRRLLRRLFAWRVGFRWYLFALLSPAVLFTASLWIKSLCTHSAFDLSVAPVRLLYPNVSPLVILPVSLLTGLLIGPLNEEIGWRGFALPDLQSKFSPLSASTILGVVWAVWHLSLFYISGMAPGWAAAPSVLR